MDDIYKLTIFYKDNITAEEVMNKLDMFQSRFRKVYAFGWWDLELIQTDAGTYFYSKNVQEGLSVRGVQLTLEVPDRQKIMPQLK